MRLCIAESSACCARVQSAAKLRAFSSSQQRNDQDTMLLVTGGAGFIGSNIVASLNDAGRTDVAVCDVLGKDGKWRNLQKRQLADFVPPHDLTRWLDGRKLDAVIHMG